MPFNNIDEDISKRETLNHPPVLPLENTEAPEDFYSHQRQKRQQFIALSLIGLIGVGVVVLGFLQFRGIISVPFPYTGSSLQTVAQQNESSLDLSQEDPAVLKTKDTDEDKLTDFDELYIYNTSPYLADSDSDTISDYDEIMNSEDPNCPKGQVCFKTAQAAVESEKPKQESRDVTITPDKLRQVLIQSGKFTKAQVDLLSDEDIMNVYQQTLKDNPQLLNSLTENKSNNETAGSIAVSAEQVRQILREQGVEEETISQFDDAELMQMYQEALKKAEENK